MGRLSVSQAGLAPSSGLGQTEEMKFFWICLLLFPAFGLAQDSKKSEPLLYKPRPKGELVSEAVAQAGGQVITSREVQISYAIDQAMAVPLKKGAPPDRKSWLLKAPSEEFEKHLAQMLLELVVQLEAENFSIGQVSSDDLAAHQKHVDEQMKAWAPWQNLEASLAEVQQMITRKLRAKNFLKFKMESSGVQISDDEAKAYYEKNRVKFGNYPFAQFKDSIKEVLAQEQLQSKLRDWFEILKRKYRVQYLGQSG